SPERRRLVEHLLKEARDAAPARPSPPADDTSLRLEYGKTTDEAKQNFRRFYNEVSKQLDASQFGPFSYFLNYGYVPDGGQELAAVPLPEKYFNKNSVKLVLEVVGDCPIDRQRVLDVGCGRGGTVYTLHQF